MGGKTIVTEEKRIGNFQVNSATYGVPVPVVIGTTRVSGNVIDWFDFTAIAHDSTQRAGKGGGTKMVNRTYTYTVAALIGLGEGPIKSVGRVWRDKDTFDSLAPTGLTLFKGNHGQQPWSYTQSKYPEKALPYSGLAYVAGVIDLGSSGSLPNLNFEVSSFLTETGDGLDANPADSIQFIIADEINGVGFGAENIEQSSLERFRKFCKAADLLISASFTEQKKTIEIIKDICDATNTIHFWSQDKLKFIPRCDERLERNGVVFEPDTVPLYDLTPDDFLENDEGKLVTFEREDNAEAYNHATVEFLNRDNQYKEELAEYGIQVDINRRGMRAAPTKKLHYLHTKARAEYVASLIAMDSLYGRVKYRFRLGWSHCLLEPGDFVTLTEPTVGLNQKPVIIDSVEEDEYGALECTAWGRPPGIYSAPKYDTHHNERPTTDFSVDPGNVAEPVIFEPAPEITETGLETWIAVAGQGPNWGGCSVWISEDNATYKKIGTIDGPARIGSLASSLPVGQAVDTVNKASVQLVNGELMSGTQQDAQNLNTLCWLDGELLAYKNATLTGAKKYDLSYLVRGAYNTPIAAHAAGARFVRVDDAVFKYPFTKEQVGKAIYLKFASFNVYGVNEQALADVEPVMHTLTMTKPPNVASVTLDEDTYILKDGTVLSDIVVRFTEPSYSILQHYNVYYDVNSSGQWQYAGPAQGSGYKINALPNTKTVKVKVCTVNKFGHEAVGAISNQYVITGKSEPPPDVTGLTLSQDEYNRANVVVKWTPIEASVAPDLKGYEVRLGTIWDTATKLNPDSVVGVQFSYAVASNGSYTFLVKAIDNSGNYSKNAISKQITVVVVPDAPTNLAAVQEPKDRSILKISWMASTGKDISGYEIRRGTVWDTAEYVTFTKETAYWYSISASGSYNFMIRAKTVAGHMSNAANVATTAMIEAYDITGFTASQMISDRTRVRLSWEPPLSLDVAYFEIRKGASWDTGIVIDQRVTGTFYDVIVLDETQQHFWIKAVTVAGKYSQNAASVEGIFNLNPAPVRNIAINQDTNDKSIVNISWEATPESDLACYEIRVGYTWETATKIGETKELRWTYRPLQTGDIKVIIKSKNAAEFYSDEAFEHYYATLEPLDVTGFQVIQNGEFVEFYWDKHPEADVVAYEIREGASFELGTLVDSGITLNSHKVKVDSERNYRYHIKAINRSNRYSQGAASQSIFVSKLPPKNVIFEYDEIARANGTHSNTEFGQSLINFSNIGGRWSDYPTTRASDVGGQTVLKLRKKNLHGNPSFEEHLNGWSNQLGTGSTFIQDNARAYDGTKSLKLIKRTQTSGRVYTRISAKAGQKISATIYAYASFINDCHVRIELNNGINYNWMQIHGTSHQGGDRWQRLSVETPVLTEDADVYFFLYLLTSDRPVWFDAFQIETDNITPYGSYYSSGQYTCQAIDVGQVITANITNQFVSTVNLRGSGSAKLQIRTSRDGQQWSEWQDFRPAQYTFRYLDRRVLLATEDATKTPEVNQFVTRIDVPDMEQTGTITVPVGGASFLYPKQYYTTPVLTPMALGPNRIPEITAKTKTGFTAKIVDRAGNDVGGQLDWRSRGY